MEAPKVFYNGHEMAAEWPARIEAAQEMTTYLIGDQSYSRIPYGREKDEWPVGPCHDCGVLKGQYHVELICDVEECPRCGWQVIGCSCPYAGDEPDEEPLSMDAWIAELRSSSHKGEELDKQTEIG